LFLEGATYFITFRLADAILPGSARPCSARVPRASLDGRSFEQVVARCEPPLTQGSCALRDPVIAEMVQSTLLYFDTERYCLHAWTVMPNHVHVVVTPLAPHTPGRILHTWKSFTAKQANGMLNRAGAFWETESFDHAIRSADGFERFVHYIEQNAVVAG